MADSPVKQLQSYLRALGLDDEVDPELKETPRRVTELYGELFSGLHSDPPTLSTFDVPSNQGEADPVIISAIPFQSMCVHHLLPFFGCIDVAYLPDKVMVGFGSIGRVVDHFSRRPQVQERLIVEIADYLEESLQPQGLLIRLRARQLCMEMRGARKTGELISISGRGTLSGGELRSELLAQFNHGESPL